MALDRQGHLRNSFGARFYRAVQNLAQQSVDTSRALSRRERIKIGKIIDRERNTCSVCFKSENKNPSRAEKAFENETKKMPDQFR
jgi:hypothetical protein